MKIMLRIFDKIKYTALFFAAFVFSMFVATTGFSKPILYPVSYTIALLDYSFGFCARILPGQIYRWISGGNYDFFAMQRYYILLTLFAYLLVSIVLSKFVKSASEGNRKYCILLGLFYASGPVTFSVFSYGLGIIDVYWIVFVPLFLLMLKNKAAKYFAPLMVIPIILIHFSAIICYMILIFFILLYLAAVQEEKKKTAVYSILFALSFVFSVSLTVYFVLFESSNAKYSAEETLRRVMERSQIGSHTDLLYFNFDIFKIITFGDMSLFADVEFPYDNLKDDILIPAGSSSLPPFIVKAINAVWPNIHFHITYYTGRGKVPPELIGLAALMIFSAPVLAFIVKYWRHRIKIAKEENKKFLGFLLTLMIIYIPVVLAFWFMCSIDFFRYYNHTLIVEGAAALFVMYKNPEDTAVWVKEQLGKYDKRTFIIYAALYFAIGNLVI